MIGKGGNVCQRRRRPCAAPPAQHAQGFRESGRLGCSQCTNRSRRTCATCSALHGSSQHVGERYAPPGAEGATDPRLQPARAQEQLRRAVDNENFELAAELRDRIGCSNDRPLLLPDGGIGCSTPPDRKAASCSPRASARRNLEGYVFSQRARTPIASAVLTRVEEAERRERSPAGRRDIRLDQLERVDRQLLHERHLVSRSSRAWTGRRGPAPVRRWWCREPWG